MKTSHLRKRLEKVPMFSDSDKTPGLQIFKLDSTNTLTDITESNPTIATLTSGHAKYDFTSPDEDCHICSIFNGYPIIFQVGLPEVKFIHYEGATGVTIPFTRVDDTGATIESGNLTELSNGFYYNIPSDLGLSIYMVNGKSHLMKVPYTGTSTSISGKILLEKDKWQLLAVPTTGKINENFVQYIEQKYSVTGSDIFEGFNAYPATDTQSSEFLSFIPGVTSPLTKHNFSFIMEDANGEQEVLGFWCKTKNYAGDVLIYDWSTE